VIESRKTGIFGSRATSSPKQWKTIRWEDNRVIWDKGEGRKKEHLIAGFRHFYGFREGDPA
jgi:hypothetical protein